MNTRRKITGHRMTIWQTVRYCIEQKYASGRGRASRAELCCYLMAFVLFCLFWLLFIACNIDYYGDLNLIDFAALYIPFIFAPPLIAAAARRLHDVGKSGWFVLLIFVPFVNILGLALLCMRGEPGPNRFGASAPKVAF